MIGIPAPFDLWSRARAARCSEGAPQRVEPKSEWSERPGGGRISTGQPLFVSFSWSVFQRVLEHRETDRRRKRMVGVTRGRQVDWNDMRLVRQRRQVR